ncbi:polysaccharide pyruvyl transferase family protein [Ideonella sp.]|uniref:polysaccharide pyruvyl transferase family protein n=1 Tax=Ideonella sp. TaxID=1929293 RepID=UPI0035B0262D
MNIVFSTTRQWNPGDEFILLGCMRALRLAGLDFNPVIFNRNPQVRRTRRINRWLQALDRGLAGGRLAPFLDNSLKDDTDFRCVDMVVFAGSPEWRGRRLEPLYRRIAEHGTPTLFLGLGTNRPFDFSSAHFSETEMAVLRAARLVTCRDTTTTAALAPVGARHVTCPALLCCDEDAEAPRRAVRRVGLIYGTDRASAHNRVAPATARYLQALYEQLLARHGGQIEFELVAHYIDELPLAQQDWAGRLPVRYHYDAIAYRGLYGRYDAVVGHRIHGVGMSASQGIPGVCVAHDKRGETARGFLAEMVTPEAGVDAALQAFDRVVAEVAERGQRLMVHKREVEATYVAALREALALG